MFKYVHVHSKRKNQQNPYNNFALWMQWRIQGRGVLGVSATLSNKSSTYLNIQHTTKRFCKTLNQMNRCVGLVQSESHHHFIED
jgi:hypothetical protein